jgi:hypothetical protein
VVSEYDCETFPIICYRVPTSSPGRLDLGGLGFKSPGCTHHPLTLLFAYRVTVHTHRILLPGRTRRPVSFPTQLPAVIAVIALVAWPETASLCSSTASRHSCGSYSVASETTLMRATRVSSVFSPDRALISIAPAMSHSWGRRRGAQLPSAHSHRAVSMDLLTIRPRRSDELSERTTGSPWGRTRVPPTPCFASLRNPNPKVKP